MQVKITRTTHFGDGKTKAICSLLIDGFLCINDVRIVEGKSGLFAALPSRKYTDKDGADKYSPYVFFDDKTMREEFQRAVMAEFNGGSPSVSKEMEQGRGKEEATYDGLPF